MDDDNTRGAEAAAEAGAESEAQATPQEQGEQGGRKKAPSKGPAGLLSTFGKQKPEPKPVERKVDEVRVSDDALASIIGLSAHEVPGVVGMAPASMSEGIRRLLGARQVDEGVVIEHPQGEGRADVDLHVVVAYGVNIPVVAESVRERVRYAALHYAGTKLDQVRVRVVGVSRG
ncbi:MAG: Asp23/Gls24 family envelope stress response protein [Truepera sp.]|jgi:uncharacterized alkaline shock family protein YloU|nr:Asp23/Gls24 family envelope stress response protein [Truepera sp.]HRN19117.1 Asp23/Gls24 family envelope stress response protein [Trueperaceae bacterium]HRQ10747.1 Asp23/Gls24 family envelope stress response protein [Trueperaceae bacterium]